MYIVRVVVPTVFLNPEYQAKSRWLPGNPLVISAIKTPFT
jgi:hypothetical protein